MKPTIRVLALVFGSAALCAVLQAQQPTPSSLPAPFATPSVSNQSKQVSQPSGAELKTPAGFKVTLFADTLSAPRTMVYAPNGDLFVAESRVGRILVMKGGDPKQQVEYAANLENPSGMAFHDGYFYVGQTTRLVRYKYQNGDTKAAGAPEQIVTFPGGGHSTRNVVFNRAGTKMYVAVGSLSNKSSGEPEVRAAVNEYNPDGSGHRIFASGLRNPVGIALLPGTDTVWVSVNERDTLGDDLAPDYITSLKDGGFYGWPYSYIGNHEDPEHKGERPDLVQRAIVPDVLLPAHAAAVSIAFYTGSQFPARYRNGAFVGLHGSWNRSVAHGYKVVFVPFQNGRPSGPPEDFLWGWVIDAGPGPITTWGRPVGVTVAPDGSLLVADAEGGRIWQVRAGG